MLQPRSRSPLFYGALVAAAAIAVIYFASSGDIGAKEVAGTFLALFGTFLGALFAFRLNEEKDRTKLLKERKAALNKALFVLLRQFNAIKSFGKHLVPFRDDVDRAFNLPAKKPPPYNDLLINFVELDFLLETDYPTVLMRLTVEQERFHQAFESVRIRNEFYVGEVQPAIANLSLQGKQLTALELAQGLGEGYSVPP